MKFQYVLMVMLYGIDFVKFIFHIVQRCIQKTMK